MKRLIPAAILVLLVFAIWYGGKLTINEQCTKTKVALNECMYELKSGNEKKAQQLAAKLEKDWDKSKMWLAVFVNHILLDDISAGISHLKSMASKDELAHFESEYTEILLTLEQIEAENRFEISAFY